MVYIFEKMQYLLIDLLNLLASELRQALDDIRPSLLAVGERLESSHDLVLAGTDLLGRVTVAQGDGVVLDGLEVDSDTEGSTQFVVTGVTLSDTGGGIIHTAGNTKFAQLGRQSLDQRLEGRVGRERNQENLGRSDSRGERKDLKNMRLAKNMNLWRDKLTPRASSPSRDQ